VSFSTEPAYRDGFGPLTPGFRIVRYGDIDDLRNAITSNTAAFLVEPIQGEAGIIVPPEGYLREAAELCRENNVLMICDEIQSGLGRSGRLFAFEYEGIRPDMVINRQGARRRLLSRVGGACDKAILVCSNLASMARRSAATLWRRPPARASLKVLVEERLVERSAELGAYFIERLRSIDSPHVVEVRGRGLWIGFVLDTKARPYCEALMAEASSARKLTTT